jgi:hypothetical protein
MLPTQGSSQDIEDHIVGVYHDNAQFWDVEHLVQPSDAPLGILF